MKAHLRLVDGSIEITMEPSDARILMEAFRNGHDRIPCNVEIRL